jgi:type II secretory pathway pseudopilin PulG
MNHLQTSAAKRGFTLVELIVAMAITIIIVGVLVSVTSIATDTWNRSRSELRASRQAKGMIDAIARDLEGLVVRRGNFNEWLSCEVDADLNELGANMKSTNAARMAFFTAVTDRYDGKLGTSDDNGGDISCVDYKLEYKDPLDNSDDGSEFKTFVLKRLIVNPDDAFADLLGETDMAEAIKGENNKNISLRDILSKPTLPYLKDVEKPENFVCENIYQFTISFAVEVRPTGSSSVEPVTLTISNTESDVDGISLTGGGIVLKVGGKYAPPDFTMKSDTGMGITREEILRGQLKSFQISITVLSDMGIDQLRRRTFSGTQQTEFLAKHSYQYSKLVQLPSM